MLLDRFIAANREEIVARCQARAATRLATPDQIASPHGVSRFLEQLEDALRRGLEPNPEIAGTAVQGGPDLLLNGTAVSQVVYDYGNVCQAVAELAVEMNASISPADFGTLNRCLEDAIVGAVTENGRARDQSTKDVAAERSSYRLVFFTHELRNLLNTGIVAFEALRSGTAGVSSSTGTALYRSLLGIRSLISRSLAESRLAQDRQNEEHIVVAEFISEIGTSAALEAGAKGIALAVIPGAQGIAIRADRQVLAAVVNNLLQNAFKFTRPHTAVTVSVGASPERVLIEIEDECGGLPGENADALFEPFEQRSANRSGLGLGLAFSRWAVEANRGRIYARSVTPRGCVFTIDLPRVAATAVGCPV